MLCLSLSVYLSVILSFCLSFSLSIPLYLISLLLPCHFSVCVSFFWVHLPSPPTPRPHQELSAVDKQLRVAEEKKAMRDATRRGLECGGKQCKERVLLCYDGDYDSYKR